MRLLNVISSSLDVEARYQIGLVSSLLPTADYDLYTLLSDGIGWTGPDRGVPDSLTSLSSENGTRHEEGPNPASIGSPRAARDRILELSPDAIHFHGTFTRGDFKLFQRIGAQRFLYSAYPGCPLVRDRSPLSFWRGGLKWLQSCADVGIASAESIAIEARSAGGWEKDFWRVIPPAFELEKFRRAKDNRGRLRNRIGIDPDTFLIGFLDGVPMPEGEEELVSVIARTRKDRPQIHYLIPLKDEKRIHAFLGRIEAERLDDLIHPIHGLFNWEEFYADVEGVFSLSRATTYPRQLIEALATGTPISAPDVGVNTELLNTTEWTSGTFEIGNIDRIVPGFYEVLAQRADYELHTREQKDYVIKKYDPRTVARMYNSLYQSLATERT